MIIIIPMGNQRQFPSGTVTFLFTDIEGSTKLAQQFSSQWESLRARHHAILQSACDTNHGFVFQIIGDAFCVAFHTASDAVRAAVKPQIDLHAENWGDVALKVRRGIHTGAAQAGAIEDRAGGYVAYLTLTRVQRVMSTAHGRPILLSNATAELLRGEMQVQAVAKSPYRPSYVFQNLGEVADYLMGVE